MRISMADYNPGGSVSGVGWINIRALGGATPIDLGPVSSLGKSAARSKIVVGVGRV
jgi:hypothetical protein